MNVAAPASTGTTALTAPSGIPVQRTSDAFTAYAAVHELGIALRRAGAVDGTGLRPRA